MDNFIKQISFRIKKPTTQLEAADSKVKYSYVFIEFNYPDFYYCNDNLFMKPENSLSDISKSLLMMNSFPYESFILQELLRLLKQYGHVYDIYFLPIGWLMGNGELQAHHACIKMIKNNSQKVIEEVTRKQLSHYGIEGTNIRITTDTTKEVSVNRHPLGVGQLEPVCVVSFYPFDPENKVLFVIYLGRYNDRYCGVSYVVDRDDMYKAFSRTYMYISDFYLVSDDINTFHTTRVSNHSKKLKMLPINHCTTLCEIVYDFEFVKFDQSIMSIPVITPYVPKQFVSIINLPDNVPITCIEVNNLGYVTHIDNKKLRKVLIVLKDSFLKNTTLQGTFKKTNIVRHGKYTYVIVFATFECPVLKINKTSNPNTCKRTIFEGSKYITKTFNDTI
ncbi:ORF-47 [Teiidae poxvirus 1]|nr:ORF-47 [Teiidae poxvirus 1]